MMLNVGISQLLQEIQHRNPKEKIYYTKPLRFSLKKN